MPRRPFRRPPLPPPPPHRRRLALRAIRRAQTLIQRGKPAQAAEIFEQLAMESETRKLPQFPKLYLQAARARFLAGQREMGEKHLRHGLNQLADMGRWPLLNRATRQAILTLQQLQYTGLATEIENWLQEILPELPKPGEATPHRPSRKLPPKCPYCGGNVLPNEVEWLDEHMAECDYCGSPLQAE